MPEIRLEHITKRWNKFYAVDDLDLVIALGLTLLMGLGDDKGD